MVDVTVIGAGVSGLAAAAALERRGCTVSVLERQVRIGGNAVSERFGGYLMEHGPTTLNTSLPNMTDRLAELGLAGTTIALGPGVRKRYLRHDKRLFGISTSRPGFLLSPYLSPAARLRLLSEIFRPRREGGGEETVHAFIARRFGTEFADKVFEPLAAGIFMGDSRTLSISGAFPRLVEMEQRSGSIMRAVLAARRGSEPGRRLVSWPGGIATLPAALSGALQATVRTGVTVTGIVRTAAGFEVKTANDGVNRADAVVLAVQPHVAAALLETLDPAAAAALSDVAAPPVAVVFLGYGREQVAHPLDGLGYLGTRSGDDDIISGVQFNSTMFGARAPEGHVAVTCYVGGARNAVAARMPRDELVAAVHAELSDLLGIEGRPKTWRVRQWARGLPQYTIGHNARREIIAASHRRIAGLHLTGNYLDGVSVGNCLETARATADTACADMQDRSGGLRFRMDESPAAGLL